MTTVRFITTHETMCRGLQNIYKIYKFYLPEIWKKIDWSNEICIPMHDSISYKQIKDVLLLFDGTVNWNEIKKHHVLITRRKWLTPYSNSKSKHISRFVPSLECDSTVNVTVCMTLTTFPVSLKRDAISCSNVVYYFREFNCLLFNKIEISLRLWPHFWFREMLSFS